MTQTNLLIPKDMKNSLPSGLIVGIMKILPICFISSWMFQAVGFAVQ